jgi:hypothetical protein
MSESVISKKRTENVLSVEDEKNIASRALKSFMSRNLGQVLSAISECGIQINTIKGIEVETIIMVSIGHSVGVKKFVWYSPGLGTTDKLLLVFGKNQLTTYLPVDIEKRRIGITVHQ